MTEEESEKLSVMDWTKLMNGYQTRTDPGTVNLNINDDVQKPVVSDVQKELEERSVEDWAKLMGANSQDSRTVNLFDK